MGTKKKILIVILGVEVAVIAAAISFLFYMNSDTVKVNRQLELAQRYLLEEDYEQAIAAFEVVIEIDPKSAEAYLGLAEAYEAINDIDMVTQTLQEGYERTGDQRIRDKLLESYLELAKGYTNAGDYENALGIYDRLLELDETDADVQSDIGDCLQKYLEFLIDQIRYDKARALIEKYRNKVSTVDFQMLLDRISALENILEQIARNCSEKNIDAVFALMHSDQYEDFLSTVQKLEEQYIYTTSYGKLGIYKIDSETYGNYMIYFGGYQDDIREGQGIWLGYFNGNNYYSEGDWQGDVPNGTNTVREWSNKLDEDVVYRVISGTVYNGLWDGKIIWAFEETDRTLSYPVTFDKGKALILGYDDDGESIISEGTLELGENDGFLTNGGGLTEKEGIIGFSETE